MSSLIRFPTLLIRASCALILSFVLTLPVRGEVVHENGIVYGKGGEEDLKLDLARPKQGAGPFPAFVLIHGGGWSGGNRAGFHALATESANRGYVAMTISYRLTQPDAKTQLGKVPFPAQINDCKCAIRWLRANADKYHVDKNRIAVGGGSAGGHLSLLVGLTDASHKLEGDGGHADQSSRVQAVVNIFGPTDMAECWKTSAGARPYIKGLIGEPDQAAEAYTAASPVTYISEDDPPVLTLHGDKDTLVPPSQAKLLDEKMKAAKAKHELLILEGAGHGFAGEAQKKSNEAMWSFLDKHLKDNDSDLAHHRELTAILDEIRVKRSNKATDYSTVILQAEQASQRINKVLRQTASRDFPAKQHLLWAARDDLPRMVKELRKDPATPSKAEESFEKQLQAAAEVLGIK